MCVKDDKDNSAVKEFGEVFTPHNIVVEMCDLPGVKDIIKDLDKTILEPTCGDGAFLTEIIRRRLRVAQESDNVELGVYKAYAGVYGVDIQEKNAAASRRNVLNIFDEDTFKGLRGMISSKDVVLNNLKLIVEYNIVVGDALDTVECVEFYTWLFNDKGVSGKVDTLHKNCASYKLKDFNNLGYSDLYNEVSEINKVKEDMIFEI